MNTVDSIAFMLPFPSLTKAFMTKSLSPIKLMMVMMIVMFYDHDVMIMRLLLIIMSDVVAIDDNIR
jgi:hypothetical protein